MSVWGILLSRLRKHATFHLIIPLGGGVFVEEVVVWLALSRPWLLSFRMASLITGVVLSYIFVMLILIWIETKKRIEETDLAQLQDTLDYAKSYYGFSIIPLTEWFDPAIQVYLAKLFNRKLEPDDFEHERTLLFFSSGEYKNAKTPFADEYHYGRCLAHMHRDCDIPLSFLRRKEIFEVLDQLDFEEKQALGCYPRWTAWWGLRRIQKIRRFQKVSLRRMRRRIDGLDFAIVERPDGEKRVLQVSKRGEEVRIKNQIKGAPAQPYIKLMQKIKDRIYDPETNKLRAENDFIRGYGYEDRIRVREIQQTLTRHKFVPPDASGGLHKPQAKVNGQQGKLIQPSK